METGSDEVGIVDVAVAVAGVVVVVAGAEVDVDGIEILRGSGIGGIGNGGVAAVGVVVVVVGGVDVDGGGVGWMRWADKSSLKGRAGVSVQCVLVNRSPSCVTVQALREGMLM